MRTTRLIITALLLTAASLGSAGQSTPYKFDIGAGLGMSGYIGEANRSSLMKHPGFVGELSFRYLPDVRWAFRGMLSLLTLSGSTADMDDVLPSAGPESYDLISVAEWSSTSSATA